MGYFASYLGRLGRLGLRLYARLLLEELLETFGRASAPVAQRLNQIREGGGAVQLAQLPLVPSSKHGLVAYRLQGQPLKAARRGKDVAPRHFCLSGRTSQGTSAACYIYTETGRFLFKKNIQKYVYDYIVIIFRQDEICPFTESL
jgi:hypothetical protein